MATSFKINQSELELMRGDLTALEVEAFVFYARSDLSLGSGFGNAISTRGGPTIKQELEKIGKVNPNEAIISSSGNLAAKHIVHAVGPKFQEENFSAKLKTTMENTLEKADEKGISEIAFPIMGGGFYGLPFDTCIQIMLESINKHLSGTASLKKVILCANDNREFRMFESNLNKYFGGEK
ncbi:MAG: macro domain-containing protein [bacterium]